MRRLVIVAFMATALVMATGAAQAVDMMDDRYNVTEDRYVDGLSHPLRVAAYAIAPVGFAAEWLIFRPFHYIISRPQLDRVFNYDADEDVEIRY